MVASGDEATMVAYSSRQTTSHLSEDRSLCPHRNRFGRGFPCLLNLSPWPPLLTLKHLAALPSCATARAVGLAPAMHGEPGYWTIHDEDGDGRACEPWPSYTRWRRIVP